MVPLFSSRETFTSSIHASSLCQYRLHMRLKPGRENWSKLDRESQHHIQSFDEVYMKIMQDSDEYMKRGPISSFSNQEWHLHENIVLGPKVPLVDWLYQLWCSLSMPMAPSSTSSFIRPSKNSTIKHIDIHLGTSTTCGLGFGKCEPDLGFGRCELASN